MDLFSYLLGKKSSSGGGGGGGSSDIDWSTIGYSETPQIILDTYNYSKQIYDNWENVADLSTKFQNDTNLVIFPLVDTSNATLMTSMLSGCTNLGCVPLLNTSNVEQTRLMFSNCLELVDVPQFDTSKVIRMSSMFTSCNKLSDDSLNNILKMCINVSPNYSRAKTLSELGLTATYYPTSRIQALPSYNDFIAAGWTIGY